MEQVRYGIIGYGKIGSQHVGKILEGKVPAMNLCAIADTNPARLAAAREKLGDSVKYFSTAKELIESGEVEAVHICTPHYFHPTIAIMALEAGLHTLVEKPAGVYTSQVREMNRVAAAHPELRFAMDFNQRTDPVFIKTRELVKSGALGQIRHTHWLITNWYRSQSYYDQGEWRATWKGEGGGVLLNQNPHNLDMWQWICGMPNRVRSQVYYGKHRRIEVEDDLVAMVEYLQHNIDAHGTPVGQVGSVRTLALVDDDLLAVHHNVVVLALTVMSLNGVLVLADHAGIALLGGVVLEQVSQHGGAGQIVDRDNLVALSVEHLTEGQAANTAKAIDSNFNGHWNLPP